MAKYIRLLAAPLALGSLLVVGACKDQGKAPAAAPGSDSALNRDLSMAGRDSNAQPQLQDVPATQAGTPAPAAAKPAPKPAATKTTTKTTTTTHAPAAKMGSIAAGTTLSLASDLKVCTNTQHVGDTFTAHTTETVTGSNGVKIPAGSEVTLEVTKLKRSENVRDPIVMEFAVKSVKVGGTSYPLVASIDSVDVTRVKNQPGAKTAQKVAIGAAAGAIAGQILGKNTKSTVIGAGVGAAAGAGVAAATANYEGCVNEGAPIIVKLDQAASIKA